MTNEQYLVISYFLAAGGGAAAAILTALFLRSPLRQAVGSLARPLGHIVRRVLPTWLILLVLFAFMSVSYFDCSHHSYQDVVKDRPHMVKVTHRQSRDMAIYLAVGLLAFTLVLAVTLTICPGQKTREGHIGLEPDAGPP